VAGLGGGGEATVRIEEHSVGLAPQKWCCGGRLACLQGVAEATGDWGVERLHNFGAGSADGVERGGVLDLATGQPRRETMSGKAAAGGHHFAVPAAASKDQRSRCFG
jgi:hypothetical protein